MAERARPGDRVADWVTDHAGSWRMIGAHMAVWAVWLPTGLFGRDRYPFPFLTLALSIEAILLTLLVLMSQQRAADRDRALLAKQAAEVSEVDEIEREDIAILRRLDQMTRRQNAHMGIPDTKDSE